MQLCSHRHNEVCFEDRTDCPVCEVKNELSDAEGLITDLRKEIEQLKEEKE